MLNLRRILQTINWQTAWTMTLLRNHQLRKIKTWTSVRTIYQLPKKISRQRISIRLNLMDWQSKWMFSSLNSNQKNSGRHCKWKHASFSRKQIRRTRRDFSNQIIPCRPLSKVSTSTTWWRSRKRLGIPSQSLISLRLRD